MIDFVLQVLGSKYPVLAQYRPLAADIRDQIAERHPSLENYVHKLLAFHTVNPRYLCNVLKEKFQCDLDGQEVFLVTDQDRRVASTKLRSISRRAIFTCPREQ